MAFLQRDEPNAIAFSELFPLVVVSPYASETQIWVLSGTILFQASSEYMCSERTPVYKNGAEVLPMIGSQLKDI